MMDVVCPNGAVVSSSPYGVQAGADILRRGGNAVDAAVATALVECVVQPGNVGIGGYGGTAVVYSASTGSVECVDFTGRAPLAATPEMFVGKPVAVSEHGYLAVVAPPIIRGLDAILTRHGTMSFAEVAAEAHRLADEGFRASEKFATSLAKLATEADEDSVRAMMPGGPPAEGDVFVQKDLAGLIERLRNEGPAVFYSGDIPRTISAAIKKHGGIVEEADFDVVEALFGEPLSVRSGDCDVHTPYPPAGGITSLQILNAMNLAELSMDDAASYRFCIEAARHAWADRLGRLGDPEYADVPMELLSRDHAESTVRRVRAGEAPVFGAQDASAGEHTVHLVTMDKHGNAVSLTETQGMWMGSFVGIPGLGLLLGNGMSRFDLEPGKPNSIAPGKRMLHNMCPLLITNEMGCYCVTGLPGGRKIVNVAALMAYAVTRLGRTCGEAISMPRFHVEGPGQAWLSSREMIDQLKHHYGNDSLKFAEVIAGPVAGIVRKPNGSGMLAASQHGPGCVASG